MPQLVPGPGMFAALIPLPCRGTGARRVCLVPGPLGVCACALEGGYAHLERECLSPHPHTLVGASCPATALAHPLPADPSLCCSPPSSAAPPSPFWLLVRTAGPLARVSGKLGVVSWGPCPTSGSLSLQWGSLLPPPLPRHRIPAPPSPEHEWAACVARGSPWGTAPSQRPQHRVSTHFVPRLGSGRLKGHFSFDSGPQSCWSHTTPGVGDICPRDGVLSAGAALQGGCLGGFDLLHAIVTLHGTGLQGLSVSLG